MPVGMKYNVRLKSLKSWLRLEKQKYAFLLMYHCTALWQWRMAETLQLAGQKRLD